MSSPSVINLLVVDRSRPDIDHIVQTLRGDGYQIELIETDQTEPARNAIDYQPLELILLRVGENLPTLAEMRLMVAEARQDIPIIAVVDDESRAHYRPARLLQEGADNFFYLDDADHLMMVVRKELSHLQARKREQSFEIRARETDNRSQALLENIQEAIAYIHEGVHAYANPAYLRLFGYENRGRAGRDPTGPHGAAGLSGRPEKRSAQQHPLRQGDRTGGAGRVAPQRSDLPDPARMRADPDERRALHPDHRPRRRAGEKRLHPTDRGTPQARRRHRLVQPALFPGKPGVQP